MYANIYNTYDIFTFIYICHIKDLKMKLCTSFRVGYMNLQNLKLD